MKLKRFSLLLISVVFLLAGCWDQRELSKIILITGIAIDVGKNGKYQLTLEGINAAELNELTEGGNTPSIVKTIEGNTLIDAWQQSNIYYSRSYVASHLKAVVVSKEIAKKGMFEFIDFLERSREIRDFNIFVAKEGKAADIIKIINNSQKSPSLKLRTQLDVAIESWGIAPQIFRGDFISALTSSGREIVMPALNIRGDRKKGMTVGNLKKSDEYASVAIDSTAVFKDNKLVGFLSVNEARYYLWTQNQIKVTIVSVPCKKDKYAGIIIEDSSTKLKGKLKNGKPHIQVNIKAEGYVGENQCPNPLDSPETFTKFNRKTDKYIEKEIGKLVKRVQQDYGADIFGFGEVLSRQDYKNFKKVEKDWNKVFKEAVVDVNVKVHIRRAGLTKRGPYLRD